MKWLLAFWLFLSVSIAPAQEERDPALKPGDIFVPHKLRIRNQNGNCVWCAAEDCFFGAAGYEEFEGIKERALRGGWSGAGMDDVIKAAKAAGIEVSYTWNGDYQVLYDAVAEGTGAAIYIPGHSIYLCGIDQDGVRVIDNNGDLKVQSWSAAKFKRTWDGCAIFPRRRKPKPVEPPPEPTPAPVTPPVEVKPGPAGPAGPQGEPGPAGPPGKDADTAKLEAVIADLKKQIEALKNQPQPKPDASAIRVIVSPRK